MKQHAEDEIQQMNENVMELLQKEWPLLKNSSLLGTWRERDRMIREIGPPMVLLHWETVRDLGRIPHSAEQRAISMEDAAQLAESHGKRFFIEMFSHRWNSGFAPDDHRNSKAR